MKKLNVKRLVAIATGAALVAAAALPAVGAAFTDMGKGDVVNPSGVPVVSVVAGANAAVSDFVWAGNIAARVAQLATKTTTVTAGADQNATPTNQTVDLTVGGTRILSGGVREFQSIALNSVSGTKEYSYQSVGNNYFKQFFNGSVNRTIDNNASVNMSIVENINVNADGRFDPVTAHDLVAVVNPLDMNYTVTFSPGIPYPFTDTGIDDYIPVYFMGKSYLLDSINSSGSDIVLIKDGADQTLVAGETFAAVGKDGKNYTVQFDGGSLAGSTPVAKFSLLDDQGVVVSTINNATANGDLIFRLNGTEVLSTKARIPANGITTTTENNSTVYFVQVIVGSGRIELSSGYEVPYDSSGTHTNIPWTVSFTTGSSLLTGITVSNQNYYFGNTTPLYAVQAFNNTGKETQFEFFKGTGLDTVGYFKYQGFYDSGVQKSTVQFLKGSNVAVGTSGTSSYGAIHYFDTAGQEHYIPMAITLTATPANGSTLTFDNWQQGYWTNSQTDINRLAVNSANGTLSGTGFNTADSNVNVIPDDVNWDSSAIVTLKGKGGTNSYKYLARRSSTNTNQVWLLLVGGSQSSGDTTNYNGYIGTMQYNTGDIFLLGTSVNDANVVVDQSQYLEAPANSRATRPYYWPDTYDFNATQSGSSTGVYRTAIFKVTEGMGTSSTSEPTYLSSALTNIFIDTESGNSGVIDTQGIGGGGKQNWSGTISNTLAGISSLTTGMIYVGTDQNLVNFSGYTGSTANYLNAFSVNGSKLQLETPASREVSLTLPSTAMKSYFTVESTDVTTETAGGEPLTGLKVGDTGTTTSGTKVTIDTITGICTAGTGACTPDTYQQVVPLTQNLVFTDESAPSGRVVIVGGYYVNSLAVGLQLADGTTLEDTLQAPGDFVAEKLSNGDMVVAGYSAQDTITAAQELVNALSGLVQ